MTPNASRSRANPMQFLPIVRMAVACCTVGWGCAECVAADLKPSPIIIDTDFGSGIDDGFALAAALKSAELDIRGITIAGSDPGLRARIVGRFLENIGHPGIPIAVGNSGGKVPIDGQQQFGRRAGFQRSKLRNAEEFLYERLKQDPGRITIVCLGRLDNVAKLIEDHPDAIQWIRQLIVSVDDEDELPESIRMASIPLHAILPGAMNLQLTDPLRRRVFTSQTPLCHNLRALAELAGESKPVLRGVCMMQLVRGLEEPVETTYARRGSSPPHDLTWVVDRITDPAPNPRYMPNHVQVVVGNGRTHRLCGYPIEERQVGRLLRKTAESLGKLGTVELRIEPDSDAAARDRLAKACHDAGWTEQRVTQIKPTVARPIERQGLPHRVHVFEDYETEIERRWWLSGRPIEENLPSNSTRAIRALPCRNFDAKMGDFYRRHRVVIFNPVPGPPMGPRTRLSFRYHLTGTDRIRVQIYSLSNGYHRSIILSDLAQGAWQTATVDMTAARRPDGSGGPLAEDERIDDIQFYIEPDGELLIDDIVLYDEAPKDEQRPFPDRFIFTGWFDTGKQGAEWPGDFEIALHEPPRSWDFARSVRNEKTDANWIRVQLRGRRPLAKEVQVRFQYHLQDSTKLGVELFDSESGAAWKRAIADAQPNKWNWAEAGFDLSAIPERRRFADEIRLHVDAGRELRIDDLLIYVPAK